jgi:hypothetical protein
MSVSPVRPSPRAARYVLGLAAATFAVGCSNGPSEARVINATTTAISFATAYQGSVVLTVPACSTVHFRNEHGSWQTAEPAAGATAGPSPGFGGSTISIDLDLPSGPEGGAHTDVLVTAERIMTAPQGWFASAPPCQGRARRSSTDSQPPG